MCELWRCGDEIYVLYAQGWINPLEGPRAKICCRAPIQDGVSKSSKNARAPLKPFQFILIVSCLVGNSKDKTAIKVSKPVISLRGEAWGKGKSAKHQSLLLVELIALSSL